MYYGKTEVEPSLTEKIILALGENETLDFVLKSKIGDVLAKMIQSGFPLDESILKKLRDLTIVEKPKHIDRDKTCIVKGDKLFIPLDMIYEEHGLNLAVEMTLIYLFPNQDPKTEALYQNMIQGISNTFAGEKNISDSFRVNELISLIIGCDLEKDINTHPLFLAFCQGNMSLCLDALEKKLVNNGLEPQEAKQKVANLLNLIDYNNKREKPGFLREIQKKLTEIFLLTNPSQEQILIFTAQVIFSPDIYTTQQEREKHGHLRGFDVEYQEMIEKYLVSQKIGHTK